MGIIYKNTEIISISYRNFSPFSDPIGILIGILISYKITLFLYHILFIENLILGLFIC
jgi:hypothetical protein